MVFIPKCRRKALHEQLRKYLGEVFPPGRVYGGRKKNFAREGFCVRGYMVSTVGRDEKLIREHIRNPEEADNRLDSLNL